MNTLETYVFWNAHDRADAPPDFLDRNDLFAFIEAASHAGLHVILRLGPYVCAEVSYGGFPFRLRDIPDIKFRTFNKPFMDEVEAWVRLVARQLHERKLLASCGGRVILVQLENEYSMVSDAYGEEGGRYLQWCADLQKELNFGVPAIMCYGAAEGVVETINAFYGHKHIEDHRSRHSDQPPVWTEAWTGWYDTWGAPHHVRPIEDLCYAVARFFAAGGAGVNYYMWAGGVNYGREGMYLQATSYDYDAPVDQFGRMTTKARHVGRLHRLLKEVFEDSFLAEREVDPIGEDGVFRWGDVFFVCNDGDESLTEVILPSTAGATRYNEVVKGRSVHIVDGTGKCLYDTATINPEDVVTRELRPVECTCAEWKYFQEALPTFENIPDNRKVYVTKEPKEQLSMTQDKSDYAFYATRVRGSNRARISFEAADVAYVYVDGHLAGVTTMPPLEDRWSNKWNAYEHDRGNKHEINISLNGTHDLCIMTASLGLVKGDWQLRKGVGMEGEAKGLLSDISGIERTEDWLCVGGLAGEQMSDMPFGDRIENTGLGWYSCTLRVKDKAEDLLLDLTSVGKGLFWVNGVLLGRFWDVKGARAMNGFLDGSPIKQVAEGDPTQRLYHIPSWVVGDKVGDEFVLRVLLFVEYGFPSEQLRVLQSC